jgi:hypothetical protein
MKVKHGIVEEAMINGSLIDLSKENRLHRILDWPRVLRTSGIPASQLEDMASKLKHLFYPYQRSPLVIQRSPPQPV